MPYILNCVIDILQKMGKWNISFQSGSSLVCETNPHTIPLQSSAVMVIVHVPLWWPEIAPHPPYISLVNVTCAHSHREVVILQRSIRVAGASLRLLLTMARSMVSVLLIHLLVCCSYGGADDNKPEQIHVGFTGISSERIVNYVTPSPSLKPETVVAYGTSPNTLNRKATGDSFVFGTGGHDFTIHNVKVWNL